MKSKFPIICLDAGHGGQELGAVGHLLDNNKLFEKDINLHIVTELKSKLIKHGYDVFLTRSDDQTITLQQRVDISNFTECDIFISIHFNSSLNKILTGTESYYHINSKHIDSSKNLCNFITEFISKNINVVNRGVNSCGNNDGSGGYMVLRENSNKIACLIECLFLSNKSDLSVIVNNHYQTMLVDSIYMGITHFVEKYWN